jgi:type I restriction enzyme R subunit
MPNPFTEKAAVQRPILKYASEIGWQIVAQDEALSLREGETGLFFYPVLKEQLLKLNPKVITSRER